MKNIFCTDTSSWSFSSSHGSVGWGDTGHTASTEAPTPHGVPSTRVRALENSLNNGLFPKIHQPLLTGSQKLLLCAL